MSDAPSDVTAYAQRSIADRARRRGSPSSSAKPRASRAGVLGSGSYSTQVAVGSVPWQKMSLSATSESGRGILIAEF